MSQTIKLKADTEVSTTYPGPDGSVTKTKTLPAGTEVGWDATETDAGRVYTITYRDAGRVYQASRPAEAPRCSGTHPYHHGADEKCPKCDLKAVYAEAAARPPVPATPADDGPPRELVLYRSKAGKLARYVVVERFVDTYQTGRLKGRPVACVRLKPADWVGDAFTLTAPALEPLTAHDTDAAEAKPQRGGPIDYADYYHDAPAGEPPLSAEVIPNPKPGARPLFVVAASDINLTAGYLHYRGWPEVITYDPDGSGVARRFAFAGLDADGEGEITGARYTGARGGLLVVND